MSSLSRTFELIDQYNAQDPNYENLKDGSSQPKELIYSHRMSQQLAEYEENPSEELQIAIRGQHIGRWKILRSDYPMDKAGYKRWRTDLAHFHGQVLGEIMAQNQYPLESIERVKNLVLKRALKRDPEAQALEDVACLVFLAFYFDAFAEKYEEDKIIDILQKTWNKMSEKGHELALKLNLSASALALINKALA
jgi:hypothetical protein